MTRHKKARTSYCRTEKKVRYPDDIAAKMAIATIRNNSNRDSVPKRCYKCKHCNGWHITSQNKRVDTWIPS